MKRKTSFPSVGCKSIHSSIKMVTLSILSLLLAFALTACGDDSSSKSEETKDNLDQDYNDPIQDDNNPGQDTIVKNASITGAALKGPFKFDSPLELHELLLVEDSLNYSGNDYIDEISSNKGDFVIPRVNLISPYAELVVEGLWQNEVSGQWSKEPLKLRALVDLNESTEVNVNLLTDLEYDRVVNLVNNGYGVLAAKKQAEFEIMTAFGFATTIENAEDLKMFVDSADSKHEANATLMAISLLFLGNRDESAIVESIDSFKRDFTPDGSWDDNQAKVEMADWAESFDNTVVRVNVKSWNILNIPKFETYLNVFWNNVYGLGGCAENRYGTIVKNSNRLSKNYEVHYICVEDQWRRATDYEKDTYQWTDGKEGETKKGYVTGADYIFRKGLWIAKSDDGDDESCDKTRAGEKIVKDGQYYACESGIWKEIDENDYYVLRNISVTGSAQKGPFKFNSPLKIKEMRLRNETLAYTGLVYEDEISSNTGDFVVPKVSLVYPYATLEVRGLWRNEITGEWSKDSMTLLALTELSHNANINILTHLEYDRALNLVKKGYSVSAAKTQADYEIMTAFAIIPTTSNSEEKLTFGEGADPTLLALAILFTGNRNDSEIQKTINNFKADIAADGVWNDEQTKANMADYAENFNSSVVHTNVKNWNISVIPDFETQLATFWNNAYGLGGCASTRNRLVLQNSNSRSSNYGVHYICESNVWRRATDYEKDTYKWSEGTTGEVKKGNVTDSYYIYNGSKWVVADRENDIGLCKGSTGVVVKYEGTYYICRSNSWVAATALEYDTYKWTAGANGDVRRGSVNTDKYYVYENGSWRASSGTIENNLGACVKSRLGEVSKLGNTYYTCKTNGWETSTAMEYDTYCLGIEKEGTVKNGCVFSSNYYVYDNGVWRASKSSVENNLGACVTNRLGEVGKSGNVYYTCKTNGWVTSTVLEYDTYCLVAERDGVVKTGCVNADKYYVYEKGTWRASTGTIENNLGACVTNRLGEVSLYGNTYYICKSGSWQKASASEYDTYGWTDGYNGEIREGRVTNTYYSFNGKKWVFALENYLGFCTQSESSPGIVNGACYACKSDSWTKTSMLVCDTYDKICSDDGMIITINGNKYTCDSDVFREASELEISLNKACVNYTDGLVIRRKKSKALDSIYTCADGFWNRSAEKFEVLLDSRDQKEYRIVTIGEQTWMAENLDYEDQYTYCYKNNFINCKIYGSLYTWGGENPYFCPSGWHLPTKTEYEKLFIAVGGQSVAGKMLKSEKNWPSGNGLDSFCFSALPGGFREALHWANTESVSIVFSDMDYGAYFWTSTRDKESKTAYSVKIDYNKNSADLKTINLDNALSVRCVKN